MRKRIIGIVVYLEGIKNLKNIWLKLEKIVIQIYAGTSKNHKLIIIEIIKTNFWRRVAYRRRAINAVWSRLVMGFKNNHFWLISSRQIRVKSEYIFKPSKLLADGSSGSDSIPENLSESGSSNYAEAPIDFNKTLLPNHSSFHGKFFLHAILKLLFFSIDKIFLRIVGRHRWLSGWCRYSWCCFDFLVWNYRKFWKFRNWQLPSSRWWGQENIWTGKFSKKEHEWVTMSHHFRFT